MSDSNQEIQAPTPDPALKRLDRLVGAWTLKGYLLVKSHELIGYDPETEAFASHVYSNFSPEPLPYK